MIQALLDKVLPVYFQYFRLPFSFILCVGTEAGILETSEPLPRWAIFSRVSDNKFMTMLGLVSYGVYLIH
jgi:peptidoglycan/LPS O-acetylase OafA/YrhL